MKKKAKKVPTGYSKKLKKEVQMSESDMKKKRKKTKKG